MGTDCATLVLRVLDTMSIYLHLEVKSDTHGYIIRTTWCIYIHVICKDGNWLCNIGARSGRVLATMTIYLHLEAKSANMVILLGQLGVFIYM